MLKTIRDGSRKVKRWRAWCVTVVFLASASFIISLTADIGAARSDTIRAEEGHVFELRVYHVLPGRMPALEARFRETTAKLLDQHGLKVVGFWVGDDNTFVFIVAHPSRAEATTNWDAMGADPAFQAMLKSEMTDKTVNKIESTYMTPTDLSPMK